MVAPSSISDISRLLNNIIRLGTIAEVDHASKRCRVRSGDLLTTWLLWFTVRAGDVRTWSSPSVGEQCTLMSPGGDLGAAVVLVGLYSDANPAPSSEPTLTTTHYPDGAVTSYDHSAHALSVTLPGGGSISIDAPVSVTVKSQDVMFDAQQTTFTGNALVQGLFTFAGGATGQPGPGGGPTIAIEGTAQISGDVRSDGDVVASNVSLVHHLTPNIRRGGEMSDPPQASA